MDPMDPNAMPMPQQNPLQQTSGSGLPLPVNADLTFWRTEVDKAGQSQNPYHTTWQQNIEAYKGKTLQGMASGPDFVNTNIDFYQTEQKSAQLFYETPDLQLRGKGPLKGRDDILQAHRDLLNELLEECDVLGRAIEPAIKDCLAVAGVGPVLIGYTPTLKSVQLPQQPGSILGLMGPIDVPIDQEWWIVRFSPKKLLVPADWHDVPGDQTPWLGMRFRMPLEVAKREFAEAFAKNPNFEGTTARDEHVLQESDRDSETAGLKYVDGQLIYYKASYYDPSAVHPKLYRELVLIDGLEVEARHRDCPHQTILPDGRLSADSMIGNPIDPLSIRFVPDSAYTPSDSEMTRSLVQELCKFRTQMVQERDANRPINLYDIHNVPPETVKKIETREIGSMVGVDGLQQGATAFFAQVVPPGSGRQTYIANDYITKDIEKVLAIDATGAGVTDDENETATKTAEVSKARNVRLDAERRRVLKWYLRVCGKFSAIVCRYMRPETAAQYIGQEAAMLWAQWPKQEASGQVVFDAKPDSQIRLDAAAERRYRLQLYQMTANDPNVVRIELLKELFTVAGLDPKRLVVEQLPEKKPDGKFSLGLTGDDLIGPQAPIALEILAQLGVQISQQAADTSAGLMFKQVALGLRDASGKPVPTATKRPAEHGGPAEPVRPLSKQQGDETGNRPGPGSKAA